MPYNCQSSEKRQRLQDRLAEIENQLAIANATIEKMLGEDVESYRLDTGEGSQSGKSRKLSEVKEIIDSLLAEADQIWRKLNCRSIVNLNLRRKYGRV